MTDHNTAYALVEDAYDLMMEKLEQDELTNEDIEECQDALREAQEHPESDIWVTMMTEGAKNKLEHQRYPEGRYQWEPYRTTRETLEEIVSPHRIEVTVS